MRQHNRVFSLAVLLLLLSTTACLQKTSGSVTPWESVTAYNATLAEANQAVEQGTEAAVSSGILSMAKGQVVISFTYRVADLHSQITAVLGKGSSLSSADISTITALLNQIAAAGSALVNDGTLGVKNSKSQNTIAGDIASINTLITAILSQITQLQSTPPSATPPAPAKVAAVAACTKTLPWPDCALKQPVCPIDANKFGIKHCDRPLCSACIAPAA